MANRWRRGSKPSWRDATAFVGEVPSTVPPDSTSAASATPTRSPPATLQSIHDPNTNDQFPELTRFQIPTPRISVQLMSVRAKIRTATPASPAANEGSSTCFTAGQRRAPQLLSRRQRKRYRRQKAIEATAGAPVLLGGWGPDSELTRGDLLLVRRAVRERWETSPENGAAIIRGITAAALASNNGRMVNSVVRVCLDVAAAQQREALR